MAVSGVIKVPENIQNEELLLDALSFDTTDGLHLDRSGVYKELRLRGYDYDGVFRGITRTDSKANVGELEWVDNWVSFMDTMLQFSIMGKDLRELYLPTRIERVILNPQKHLAVLEETQKNHLPCYMYKDINVIKSGGVEMRGLRASLAPRKSGAQTPKLEKYCFVPNHILSSNYIGENCERSKQYAYSIAIHLVLENSNGALKLKVTKIY